MTILINGVAATPSSLSELRADLGVTIPSNNLFALVGDSRAAADHNNSTASLVYHNVSGIGWWAQTLSRGRVRFPIALDYAVGGSNSEQMLATQIPAAVASTAANVLMLTSTNDRAAMGWDANRTIAALSTSIQALINAGKVLWIVAELPRGDSGFTAARLSTQQLAYHMQVRRWILECRERFGRNVYVIDAYPRIANLTSTTGDISILPVRQTYDGLHPNGAGACTIAQTWLADPFFDALYGGPDQLTWVASDAFSADNPRGNLLGNGLMTGTGGTVGGGMTGQVADGWTAQAANLGSVTAAWAKVTTATGDWQQLTLGGSSGGSQPSISLIRNITYANVSAGDVLDASAEFEIDAGSAGIGSAAFGLWRSLSGANVRNVISGQNQGGLLPNTAHSGVWRLPDTQTIAGGGVENIVQAQMLVQPLVSQASVSLVLRVRNFSIRKV